MKSISNTLEVTVLLFLTGQNQRLAENQSVLDSLVRTSESKKLFLGSLIRTCESENLFLDSLVPSKHLFLGQLFLAKTDVFSLTQVTLSNQHLFLDSVRYFARFRQLQNVKTSLFGS